MGFETLEDIQRLIDNKIEESLTLEYKRELNNKQIAIEVSAFANTEGGIIVYGLLDKDKIPTGTSWVVDSGVEERIQNVIMTAIHPKVEGVKIVRLPNPSCDSEAVFVVDVPKSLETTHMAHNRYYRRRGSVSTPMEDIEVKNTMFSTGRRAALRYEIAQNLELAIRTQKMMDQIYNIPSRSRRPIALIPFHTYAWNAVVASGFLYSLGDNLAERLVKAYSLVHEINSLIEWLKLPGAPIVYTPADPSSAQDGIYIPSIIKNRIADLCRLLNEIASQLQAV